MSAITTHVLDVARGRPASGMTVVLERQSGAEAWAEVGRGVTDGDGRIPPLAALPSPPGVYRLTFDTGAYFRAQRTSGFYPKVAVVFEVGEGEEHHHVPLLLSPFGYTTYRGS
jgi:5-hydroxyisourate hydrolase